MFDSCNQKAWRWISCRIGWSRALMMSPGTQVFSISLFWLHRVWGALPAALRLPATAPAAMDENKSTKT